MSPSCYLLLFKSENNKKGRLTWVSNLPTLLVPEKEKASHLLGMQQGSCSSVNFIADMLPANSMYLNK